MEVLDYLQTHTIEELTEEFAIKVKEYPEFELAVLNYDQINSPKYHSIVQECRGLIINTKLLTVVSSTFKRFYNVGENENDLFNWNRPFRAEEKADGSLISVYWYWGEWHMATRGTAFGEAETATGQTFREIFELACGKPLNEFMWGMFKNQTYTFELCSIFNKVVKLYNKPRIYLLNIVHPCGEVESEALGYVARTLEVNRPEVFDINSMEEAVEMFSEMEATDEGFVFIDCNGNRIKAKNPSYVDLHHMKGNDEITPKRIADVVFRGETEEILTYFPEYRELFAPWQTSYNRLINFIDVWDRQLRTLDLTQKGFALEIKDLHFKGILFSMRKGLTMEESFGKVGTSSKVGLLEGFIKN